MPTRCVVTLLCVLLASTLAFAADAPRQVLYVRYDPEERILEGTLDITLDEPAETVYFMLPANFGREQNPYVSPRIIDETYPFGFEPGEIEIESVDLVQSPSASLDYRWLAMPPSLQTFSLDETILAVDLVEPGDEATLRIRFTTHAPRVATGDDGVTDGVLTWRFGWYPLLVEDAAEAFEEGGVLHIGETGAFPLVFPYGEMEATFTLPAEVHLFTGADRTEVDAAIDPSDESAWIDHHAAFDSPTRALAITIGADYETYTLDGETPIVVAYLPGREEEARLLATYARDILDAYEPRLGDYPRERLTIVQNPNRSGSAFAAEGIVWLSDLFFTHRDIPVDGVMNRFLEYVLAHEIAHQWLGLGTGVDLDTDAWLSEGLAQYASISYFESRHGAFAGNLFDVAVPGLLEEVVDRQFGFLNLREHQTELPYVVTLWSQFDEALVRPTQDLEYANANVSRLYDKGYLVARAIAATIGEETFDRALRAAFSSSRAGRLDAATFQEILEAEADQSLDELFSAWVFGDVSADYSIDIESRTRTQTGYETTLVVRRAGGIPQPVEIEAVLSSEATLRRTWDGTSEEERLVLHTPSRVVRATIDPDHRLPDSNRLNNNDPVKVVTAVNRAAYPLDAYLISPSSDTTGFSFSWINRFQITVEGTEASMVVNVDRNQSYAGSVSLGGGHLTGWIAYRYTHFDQPETGSPSTYWLESSVLTTFVERFLADDEAMWSLGVSAAQPSTFASSATRSASLEVAENAAVKLALSAFDEVRLLPNFYLQGTGTVGFSVGDLPEPMCFDFDELHAPDLSSRPNKLTGRVSLELAGNDTPYNLANLAMLDGFRTRLFLAGGLGWTSPSEFGTTAPSVEAGIEQILELSTLGGLLPLSVRLGVATPVKGPGTTVFYVGVSL